MTDDPCLVIGSEVAGMFERSGRPPEQLHQIQVSVQAEGKFYFVESKEASLL